ncbi:hypothetical protein SDAV_001634 [Spiroplasma phoeniceum P40]|uniref:Uncharacterized protein n=1 Tax=Spiroplasma phoeniceum P40 TaxID=1276259 RepID=A0A345DQV0_9MOLU|nr:hypothetical protein SDAV_001634 [Spiroplasma phoeniceum P40]
MREILNCEAGCHARTRKSNPGSIFVLNFLKKKMAVFMNRINKIIKGKIFQTIEYIKHQFNRIKNVAMK